MRNRTSLISGAPFGAWYWSEVRRWICELYPKPAATEGQFLAELLGALESAHGEFSKKRGDHAAMVCMRLEQCREIVRTAPAIRNALEALLDSEVKRRQSKGQSAVWLEEQQARAALLAARG